MLNFRLFNMKIKFLIVLGLVMVFWKGTCPAMEMRADGTLEEMLHQLSMNLEPETLLQFASYSADDSLEMRINTFLTHNNEFLTENERISFYGVLESIQTQQLIAQSIEFKNNDEQIRRDGEIARNLYGQKPIASHVKQVFEQLQLGNDTQKNSVGKFREILAYLKSHEKTVNLDVHFFDSYIFGGQKKILHLIEFGNFLQVDNAGLTLAQVGQEMNLFITNHPNLFIGFKYLEQLVTPEALKGYVNTHFCTMDAESLKICPEAKTMWSKTWSLALNLYAQDDNATAIKIIFEQVCENYLAQGGCIQGRINRGFVGYVCLLTNCCGLQF